MCLLQPVLCSLSLSPPPSLSPYSETLPDCCISPSVSSNPQWSYFFQHLTLPETFCFLNCLCLSPTVGCKVHKNWELLSFFFFFTTVSSIQSCWIVRCSIIACWIDEKKMGWILVFLSFWGTRGTRPLGICSEIHLGGTPVSAFLTRCLVQRAHLDSNTW